MLRLGMLARNVATSPVAVGQELAAIWPKMICRRVDKLGPSTFHLCSKNRIGQICRNVGINSFLYILDILDFRLYYI